MIKVLKKVLLTLIISVFGVLAVPTSAVFADPAMDDTTGGGEEYVQPSQAAKDATLDKAYDAGQRFWQECVFRGHDSDTCEHKEVEYEDAMWDWYATELAYAWGENVKRYVEPTMDQYMPIRIQTAEPQPGLYDDNCLHEGCC